MNLISLVAFTGLTYIFPYATTLLFTYNGICFVYQAAKMAKSIWDVRFPPQAQPPQKLLGWIY